MLGKTCEEAGVFKEEWAERMKLVEPTVIETGKAVRAKEWVTYPDGRRALLEIGVSPLRDSGGAIIGIIVVGRDVTEQNRLEEQLRQSQKMEAVGRLAGGIAHDFNNLLTVILGNLELLRGGASGPDAAELVESTERAATQAAELTKQMLGFARRQPLRTVTLDLNPLVKDALNLIRRSIDRRIAIDFRPAADLLAVTADPVQMQQVVMNLCLNARDAMPDGGTLIVETANAGGRVRLSVADTGMGMTEEVRLRIFEPFFTTKDVGKGTGLGLAVVYGAAQAHGGTVECHSVPGQGSRFDVYLPRGSGEPAVVVTGTAG
jgi:signal transduction histidine kinase